MTDKARNAADLRQQRVFGITLAEKEAGIAKQGGVCKICRRPPGKYQLSTDHDHRYDRVKVLVIKVGVQWAASAKIDNVLFTAIEKTRPLVRIALNLRLRRASIRGYLCQFCNRGLRYYQDKPERFDNAAKYLREFRATRGLNEGGSSI